MSYDDKIRDTSVYKTKTVLILVHVHHERVEYYVACAAHINDFEDVQKYNNKVLRHINFNRTTNTQ